MLKLMRDSFQHLKWILVAVVAIFILFIFVDWGAGGAGGGSATANGYAARVNGETISFRDYNRALYYAEQNYRQMYGDQFTPEMAEAMGLNRQVLDSLVEQRLMLQQAQRLHLSATPEEVRRRILEIPLLNPDGKFVGAELYGRYVTQLGFNSPGDFEDELARQITIEKIESAMVNSVAVLPKAADDEMRRTSESAKIRYILYSASREAASTTVTPAEVDAFYAANQSRYAHGEQRSLKYLVADTARLRSQIVPTEQQLRARYDAVRDSEFKRPESAHILHILIKVDPNAPPDVDAAARAKAESIVKQLRAGGDFAKLAKDNSQDPSSSGNGGDMGFIDRGMTVPSFDQAAFTIPLNTISDPIRSPEYGYHIIKVVERREPGYRSFEEVRSQLATQLAAQTAQDQSTQEITRIAARVREKKPANATEFGIYATDKVSSNDTQWFQKGDLIPGLGRNTTVSTWAFAAKPGDVSDVIGTERGPIIAYVSGVRPAGVTALAEIRERVSADAKTEKARNIAKEKLASAAAGAQSVDAAAAKVGASPVETNVSRQGIIVGIPGDTTALVDAVMAAPVGQVRGPVAAGDGAVIFQVIEQKKMSAAELAQGRQSFLDQLRVRQARTLRSSLLQRLRKDASVDINQDALKQTRSNNPA